MTNPVVQILLPIIETRIYHEKFNQLLLLPDFEWASQPNSFAESILAGIEADRNEMIETALSGRGLRRRCPPWPFAAREKRKLS